MLVCKRLGFGAKQETHGWACHFGASHRRFTGKRSQGHAWAWRIIIFALAGRLSGLLCMLRWALFAPHSACDCLGLSRAGVRVSVVARWPAGYRCDHLTYARATVPRAHCAGAGDACAGLRLVLSVSRVLVGARAAGANSERAFHVEHHVGACRVFQSRSPYPECATPDSTSHS